MAIGRISGSVLKSNLTRNGVDLAFETNLLYLDVTNSRVGIGTSEPISALHVNGNTTITGNLNVSGSVNFETSALTIDTLNTGALLVEDNKITGLRSNENIEITPSGSGVITVGGSILPSANITYNLGSSSYRFNQLWLAGSTIDLGGTKLSVNELGDFEVKDSGGTRKNIMASSIMLGTGANPIKISKSHTTGKLLIQEEDNSTIPALTVVGDDSSGTHFNLGETFKIAGTRNLSTTMSGDTLTITGPDLSSYATQSYVTSQGYITNSTITLVGDDSTGTTFNAGETIKIAGGSNITTSVSGDTLTINGSNPAQGITFLGDDSTGTAIADGGIIQIIGTQNITTAVNGEIITITGPDLSSYITNSSITFVGDDSTGTTLNTGETLKIAGTRNITTAVSGDTLTITGPDLSSYATQSYVDSQVVAANTLTIADDSSTTSAIDLDNTVQFLGGNNISTTVSGSTITFIGSKNINVNSITSDDSSAIQINDALNVAGNINVQGNTVTGLASPSSASDAATKDYVDSQLSSYTPSGSGITFVGDDSTGDTILLGDT